MVRYNGNRQHIYRRPWWAWTQMRTARQGPIAFPWSLPIECHKGLVGLAAFAAHAVGHHEHGRHHVHGLAELGKLPAHWWAPVQASLPIRQVGNCAVSSISLPRGTSGRTRAGLPVSSTPCTAKTFFAKSIPLRLPCRPFTEKCELMNRFASPSWHCIAVNRNPDSARLAWDGKVPFIC